MFASFVPIIYVQIAPQQMTLRNAKTGVTISEVPEAAIRFHPKPGILAVGTAARSYESDPAVKIVNPFAHPRSMVSDFTVGEQVLKAFLLRMQTGFFAPSPNVVMHLLGEPAGGFTQVEIRAFLEMALGAGAAKVKVWQGRRFGDQELLCGQFPVDGQVLS